jgi:hypothetical protein
MPKLLALNVVHVVVASFLFVVPRIANSQESAPETVMFNGAELQVVPGRLLIRMTTLRSADELGHLLPDGFRVEHQYLRPERTRFFSFQSIVAQETDTTMTPARVAQRRDLFDAEERLTRTFTIAFEGPRSVLSAAGILRKTLSQDIEIIEPWTLDQVHAGVNDPLMPQQDYLRTIGFDKTWEIFKGSDSITIGISDDGIFQGHEDLSGNIAVNNREVPNNEIDDDGNGYIDDHRGFNFSATKMRGETRGRTSFDHGTRVAGLAAASTDNSTGIAAPGMRSRFFPMAVAGRQGGIQFGYQSLVYAAERGFAVVNASWGAVKPASAIDQSVIDFCLAKDVVVIASAGNHGGDQSSAFVLRNYPASYPGVLGVGETTPDDFVISSSALGGNADVMAPGNMAITTYGGESGLSEYTSSGTSGTSFAAPLVTGAAAIVRARWPQLTARQVAAHIRRTADNITSVNNGVVEVISPRLNMFRAVTVEPLSQPAMRIASVRKSLSSGLSAVRFRVGDTIFLEFDIANDLEAAWTELEPRIIAPNGWNLRALRERDQLPTIPTAGSARSKPFPFVVDAIGTAACLMRVEFLGESFQDFDFYYLELPAPIARFENDSLVYSMSDDGMVGYTSIEANRQGSGFAGKPFYQLMSPGGLFVVDGSERSATGFKNNPPFNSDFVADKPFDLAPQPGSCRMSDAAASAPMGVEVTQTCSFPFQSKAITVWNVSVTPRTAPLPTVAAGYLLDWDVTSGGRDNTIESSDQALPQNMRMPNAAAQLIYKESDRGAICVAVQSDDADDRAQSIGVLLNAIIDDADGFTHRDRVQLLSAGKNFSPAVGDICGVVGMRRTKPLEVGQTWSFKVMIASASNWGPASDLMREFLSPVSVSQENVVQTEALVIPNPVTDIATVRASGTEGRCTVFDVFGRERISWFHSGEGQVTFDASTLEKGAYTLRIEDARSRQFRHLRFVR